jgi:hypothetical protein
MESTPSELASLTLVVDAFKWAQLKQDAVDSILDALGIEKDDFLRVLAAVSDKDWNATLEGWMIESKGATPAQKAKAAVARGVAQKAANLNSKPAEVASAAVPPHGHTTIGGLSKFKLNTVVNQASDVELIALDGKAIAVAYANYRVVFGTVPPPDEELTAE